MKHNVKLSYSVMYKEKVLPESASLSGLFFVCFTFGELGLLWSGKLYGSLAYAIAKENLLVYFENSVVIYVSSMCRSPLGSGQCH